MMDFWQTLIVTVVAGLFSLAAALIVARGGLKPKKKDSAEVTGQPAPPSVVLASGGGRWLRLARGVRDVAGLAFFAAAIVASMQGLAYFHPKPSFEPQPNSKGRTPVIHITEIPAYDPNGGPASRGLISGEVSGVDPRAYRVVIYAHTNLWYVQPYVAEPVTGISSEGKWANETHLGSDYAALLVKPEYTPPSVTEVLPTLGGEVIASTGPVKGARTNEER